MKPSEIPEIRRVDPDTEWDEEYWDGFVEDYSETKRKQKRRESRRGKLHYAPIALELAVMTLLRRRARRQKMGCTSPSHPFQRRTIFNIHPRRITHRSGSFQDRERNGLVGPQLSRPGESRGGTIFNILRGRIIPQASPDSDIGCTRIHGGRAPRKENAGASLTHRGVRTVPSCGAPNHH